MNVTREEAIAALRDVEDAETRTLLARCYQSGAPHLILWGVVWVIGYTLSGLAPPRLINPMWLLLSILGIAGAVLLNARTTRANDGGASRRLWLVSLFAVWIFFVASFAVMRPSSSDQYQVYPALVVALVYSLAGAWGKPRYLWIGGAVFVLSLVGFFFLKPVLPFWLAAVGGGGLILGGVWLRRP